MASHRPPTILLVPGALTTPACYDLVQPYLKQHFPVAVASLASSNPQNPDECTAETDGQFLLNQYLLPLVTAGEDVIVFAHSFGATSLSGAHLGLSKMDRQASGLAGGIIGLVYISFAMVPNGQTQVDYCGAWPPFAMMNHPSPGLFVFNPVIETLFKEADPADAEKFAAGHTPHSMKPFETPVSGPLWTDPAFDGHRVLIKTMWDGTFPPEAQQTWADHSGVDWKIVEVDGGHDAFMTKPMEVAKVITDSVRGWSWSTN